MYYAIYHVRQGEWAHNGLHVDTLHMFTKRKERDAWVAESPTTSEAVTSPEAQAWWWNHDHIAVVDWSRDDARYAHRPPWDKFRPG